MSGEHITNQQMITSFVEDIAIQPGEQTLGPAQGHLKIKHTGAQGLRLGDFIRTFGKLDGVAGVDPAVRLASEIDGRI